MEQVVAAIGWFVILSAGVGVLGSLTVAVVRRISNSRPRQIIGAELPVIEASIDGRGAYLRPRSVLWLLEAIDVR